MLSERHIPPLRCLYLYVSGSCNLACRHCWIDPRAVAAGNPCLEIDAIQTIVRDAKGLGLESVKLTGGEPFLYPQILELLQFLRGSEVNILVETNATLVGTKEAQVLREVAARCSVSLDGTTAEQHEALRKTRGSFESALSGIRALRSQGVEFQVIASLYRANSIELLEMPAFARSLGASSLKVNPINGLSRSSRMRDSGELFGLREVLELYEELRPRAEQAGIRLIFDVPPALKPLHEIRSQGPCTCGISGILGVLHNGHASLCGIGEVRSALDFGDATVLGVRRIWEDTPLLRQIRERLPTGLEGVCGRCIFKHYCLGKCLAHTFVETGNLFAGHPLCETALSQGLFPVTRLIEPPRPEASPTQACEP